ncbi:hypothetical protein D3C86_2095650 [compost metagenome]
MNEKFNGGVCRLVNIADLIQIQLARQHYLGETNVRQEFRFFDGTNIALGAGMQFNRRNIQFEHAHVLNDQGIDAGLV